MMMATCATIISLIVFVGILAGFVVLQVYLSKRESKIPGLILPAVSFAGELFILLNLVVNVTANLAYTAGEADGYSVFVTVLNALLTLLFLSVPTIVLLAIYFICRRGKDRKKQLDKMNIQDL